MIRPRPQRHLVAGLLAWAASLPVFAASQSDPCQELYGSGSLSALERNGTERPLILASLPQNPEQGFSEPILSAIKEHPIYAYAQRLNKQGAVDRMNFHLTFGLNPDWTVKQGTKGEGQQGLLIRDILKFLFPEASFRAGDKPVFDGKRNIFINVVDSAEHGTGKLRRGVAKKDYVQMSLLKAGNPIKGPLTHEQAKAALGLEGKRVVHLYVPYAGTLSAENKQILVSKLKSEYSADFLILSFGNNLDIEKSVEFATLLNPASGKPWPLSTLRQGDLSNVPSGLIFNDTIGNMPMLHSASDLSVVVGPINFFQPLAEGTRTVHINTPEIRGFSGYDATTLQKMAGVAKQSQGFLEVESFEQVGDALKTAKTLPAPLAPAFVKIDGKSSFDRVLDRLRQILIQNHLGDHYRMYRHLPPPSQP